jgi:hypothetical protein
METNPINPSQAITVEEYITQIRRRAGGSVLSEAMRSHQSSLLTLRFTIHKRNRL